MKKISWTDRVGNEEIFYRVREERNVLHTTTRKKDNWIGYIPRRELPSKTRHLR
jgi:hypothetical protein